MATSLAAQLAQIAAKSKISLDIKAQKALHGKSLLFEPRVAAGQSFASVFAICREGFDELCQLDERFVPFGETLFSELSQEEDRTQMSEAENAALDRRIEAFLRLAGAKLRLLPAVQAVEWLVRRFRIHEYNTTTVITTFLPFHSLPVFVTLLSILPAGLPHAYRFLSPYVRSLTAPPRAAIVQQATQHVELVVTLSTYTLAAARAQQAHAALVTFWGGVLTEAINGMLDAARSGRRSVMADQTQTVLQQVGPLLGEALVARGAAGVQVAAYMAVAVFVSKARLSDTAVTAFMDQLVAGWTPETVRPGLACLAILAQHRSARPLSRKVAKAVLRVPNLAALLVDLGRQRCVDKLASGLVLALTERLAKKAAVRSLPVIQAILVGGLLQERQLVVAFKALLVAAHSIPDALDPTGAARKALGATLVVLAQAPAAAGGDVLRAVIADVDLDMEELELRLDATLRPRALLAATDEDGEDDGEDTTMALAEPERKDSEAVLARLAQLPRPASFLASPDDDDDETTTLLDALAQQFLTAVASGTAAVDQLDAAPLLGRAKAATDCFYLGFLVRVWTGTYPALGRVAALQRAAARLGADDCAGTDFQALLPYTITALADPATKVRKAATQLLAALVAVARTAGADAPAWGRTGLYMAAAAAGLTWLSVGARDSLLGLLTDSADEAVLHKDHLAAALQATLDKTKTDKTDKTESLHLSHGTRLALLTFLASHTVATPLLAVQVRLLVPLNAVRGVSGTTRTALLLPVLQAWTARTAAAATAAAARAGVAQETVDASSVDVVVANDAAGQEALLAIVEGPAAATRPGLLAAALGRIRALWPAMKEPVRAAVAQRLLDTATTATADGAESAPGSEGAAGVLQEVTLSTAVLGHFLDGLPTAATKLVGGSGGPSGPGGRRPRRTSAGAAENNGAQAAGAAELRAMLQRMTFVLQLVQGASPERHPGLLPGLFAVLAELQALRAAAGSELGYLQSVVLGSLLAMMPAFAADRRLQIDTTVGHGDVLVGCIHTSSSPAVRNAALLLVARLASTAPAVVLHSVMPIFTLMGGSVLRQDDDYAAHVVQQTLREVIPPLIETFRRGRRPVVASAAALLASFVMAYEHMPAHRRRALFLALVEHLGPADFLAPVLAMFADRYGAADSTRAFLCDLAGAFPAAVQLQALVQLVALVADVLAPRPGLSATLLGRADVEDTDSTHNHHTQPEDATARALVLPQAALRVLTLLPALLGGRRLREAVGRLDAADDDLDAARLRELYVQLLEDVLGLADAVARHSKTLLPADTDAVALYAQLHSRCADALAPLLNLQAIGEFVRAVETLLDRPALGVRHKVLRALEVRVAAERATSSRARTALLAFLPQLTAVIRDAPNDPAYQLTAVTCVDRIADKYGRRDLEAVGAAAAAIAGDSCLGRAANRPLQVMALLCLASLVDVLREAAVPVLPAAVPRTLACLRASLDDGNGRDDAALHNAAWALLAALAQHLPYMLTGAYLDRLLPSAWASAETSFGGPGADDEAAADAPSSRRHALQLLARQVDAAVLFPALQRSWRVALATGSQAALEFVQVLSTAIDHHGKAAIAKNLPALSALLQATCDMRRQARMADGATTTTATTTTTVAATIAPQLDAIETAVQTAMLHMVLQLHDAAFRPVFADLVAWADRGLPTLDVLGRCLRQQSVYAFATLLFDRLKGAVTGYAVYVVDGLAAALQAARVGNSADDRLLWVRALQTLTACCLHDADADAGYWQVPAHFAAVAPVLVAQCAQAPALAKAGHAALLETALVPAIVQLARAAHAPAHQKDLNGRLLRRLRSPQAAERLAVVRCQQALAADVGEEWLAMLPEMLPYISELQDDDDDVVERETHRWINTIEGVLGESLDAMLQ